MIKKQHIPFYVINENVNAQKFEPYDVMPYLIECYKKVKRRKNHPTTFDEFKKFVKDESMYMYWSRCQYEIVLKSWPSDRHEKKIDVYWQLMMNIDIVTKILIRNVGVKL